MANRKRPKQVVIRMTEEEFQKVKEQVDKSGKKQQDYLIKAITNKPIVNCDGVKAVVPELKRIGNNVNQIAKACNQGDIVMVTEIQAVQKELKEAWQLLRQLVQGRA